MVEFSGARGSRNNRQSASDEGKTGCIRKIFNGGLRRMKTCDAGSPRRRLRLSAMVHRHEKTPKVGRTLGVFRLVFNRRTASVYQRTKSSGFLKTEARALFVDGVPGGLQVGDRGFQIGGLRLDLRHGIGSE